MNYKTLSKDIKEDLKKWRYTFYNEQKFLDFLFFLFFNITIASKLFPLLSGLASLIKCKMYSESKQMSSRWVFGMLQFVSWGLLLCCINVCVWERMISQRYEKAQEYILKEKKRSPLYQNVMNRPLAQEHFYLPHKIWSSHIISVCLPNSSCDKDISASDVTNYFFSHLYISWYIWFIGWLFFVLFCF